MIVRVRQTEPAIRTAAAVATSSLSHVDDSGVFDSSSPLAWLQAAREIPQLAKVLADSTQQVIKSDSRNDAWKYAFLKRPQWAEIARLLQKPTEGELDPDATLLAELARSVAVTTGWADADEAFWTGLLSSTSSVKTNLYLAAESLLAERNNALCVTVAELLLRLVGRRNHDSIQEFERARMELEYLRLRFPTVDWQALVYECHELSPVSASVFLTPPERELFVAWAQLSATKIENDRERTSAEMCRSASSADFFGIVSKFLVQIVTPPFAFWISDISGLGSGMVVDAEPTQCTILHSPADLQSRLSHSSYCRTEITDSAGTSCGYILSVEPLHQSECEIWLPRVSQAVELRRSCLRTLDERNRLNDVICRSAERDLDFRQRKFQQMIAEFSAGAGHEINNPLGTIAGKVQTLLRGENDPNRRQALHKISEQVDRIHRMIRDLHFIGSHVRAEKSNVSIMESLTEAYSVAAAKFETQRLTLEHSADDWEVFANKSELVRMFVELIVNGAEAAGEQGRVMIRARAGASNLNLVEVQIQDTGPGFSEKDMRHAFDPFYSGRSAGRGLGMGLCVVRRISDDHGMTIILGAGRPTVVTVLVPFSNARLQSTVQS